MQTEEELRWVKSPEKGEFCINSFKLSSTSCFTYPYGEKLRDNKDSTQTHLNTFRVSFSSLPSSSSLAAAHPRQRDGTECFFILTWMSGLGHYEGPCFYRLGKEYLQDNPGPRTAQAIWYLCPSCLGWKSKAQTHPRLWQHLSIAVVSLSFMK